jgi:hypothetical protein
MKVLISGIVGAAVATTAWLSLEYVTHKEFGWLACLVGIVTGLSIHWAAGAHARASFGRGALAVLLTLAACVGGRLLYVKVMESVRGELNVKMAQVVKSVENEGEAGADTEKDSTETSEEDAKSTMMAPRGDRPATSINLQKPTLKTTLSQGDMLWLCLAALVAYVVGKGNDTQPTLTQPAQTPEQPPA